MRLINVHTKHMTEFYDAETPPYAILSHTWGDDEVTYLDMVNDTARNKSAYFKIRQLCSEALVDKVEWAWLDTCCIDKNSSPELMEAINSMFRWYNSARVCYAYLEDVSPDVHWDDDYPFKSRETLISELRSSRWFTRGWTLQELLAPRTLKLYGHAWNFLGNRDGLAPLLISITSIRESVLKHPEVEIDRCSVAEKMSWAASRETSRKEDLAYCLLGIFRVNMPMLYGEGDRAFLRLQEEIIRSTDDQSIFVWQPQHAEERHILLAPAPDRFKHGDLIETIPSMQHMDGHNLGNTGLRITLPLIKTGIEDCWHAILACKYRDDYSNVIALCLRSKEKRSEAPLSLYVAPTIALSQRYVEQEVPLESYDLPIPRTIIVTRNMPKLDTVSAKSSSKYWLRIDKASPLKIVGAYPPECFNSQKSVMDLSNSTSSYGAALIAFDESAASLRGFKESSYQSRPLAIVFGSWCNTTAIANTGIFGIVQTNVKNLDNACRLAVSRSIYRSNEPGDQHVAWVRSVYTVAWTDNHLLNVSFDENQQIGMLREVVNVMSIKLQFDGESKTRPMPILKQTDEPNVNPMSIERLQDVVRSWTEQDVEAPVAADQGPDPNAVYELEDDSALALRQPPPRNEDSDSDEEPYYDEARSRPVDEASFR